ncbi:MAG: NifB/NifX family molybdenum-iron cluster-binding protein [Syntrophomonadaceae bacterium]|nr:NifB/NifX family molybdenum-iron cluster-binding protein [Syntrophomonadaceae bacterium]
MGKIAICSSGSSSSSLVDGRFGRCSCFMVWDPESSSYEAVSNQGQDMSHGAGTGAAQAMINQGVKAVITSRIGPKAFSVLKSAGIEVYMGEENKTVEEVLQKYLNNELNQINSPNN